MVYKAYMPARDKKDVVRAVLAGVASSMDISGRTPRLALNARRIARRQLRADEALAGDARRLHLDAESASRKLASGG